MEENAKKEAELAKQESFEIKKHLSLIDKNKDTALEWKTRLIDIYNIRDQSKKYNDTIELLYTIKDENCLEDKLLNRIEESIEDLENGLLIYRERYIAKALGTISSCINMVIKQG